MHIKLSSGSSGLGSDFGNSREFKSEMLENIATASKLTEADKAILQKMRAVASVSKVQLVAPSMETPLTPVNVEPELS